MQGTNDMTMARPASALRSPGALVGGALLVAALGAGAGWMMRGPSPEAQPAPQAAVMQPVPGGAMALAPQAAASGLSAVPAEQPADEVQAPPPRAAAQALPAPVQSPAPRPVHRNVARAPAPAEPVQPQVQAPVAQAPAVQPAPVCHSCGVVESVQTVRQEGPAQGIGAVAGGVLGGVLGNQVGGGTGRKVATVLGAVGGGFAGHEIEKRVRSETVYEVRVRMEDGSVRRFSQPQPIATGTRVVEEGGRLRVR
jgi:outer membrane lipoprotein SlyB